MIATAPTPEDTARSLARDVRHRLVVAEKPVADLVLADFDDALNRARDAHERILICRTWLRWLTDLRSQTRNF